jgi:uncharacterized protein
MNIGITGRTGFIGGHVAKHAQEKGHAVTGFSRSGRTDRMFSTKHPLDCTGLDAVIHLAGESILGLWTTEKKRRILESRTDGTRRVVEGLRDVDMRPRVLVCASAVGYYGNTGEDAREESAAPGVGFLADVVRAWECEAMAAVEFGVRVVCLRIGFVIGKGGAMRWILPVFRLGLGGNLGSGRQWMSGIHVEDVAGMAVWAAENEVVSGPVNAVMPEPFRNRDFTKAVAHALRRPAFLPAPAPAIRMMTGGLSALLLDSVRVLPGVAQKAGYAWRHASLEKAVASVVANDAGGD